MAGIWIDVSFGLFLAQALEVRVFADDADRQVLVVELRLVGQRTAQSFDAVIDEVVQVAVLERVQMLLQVRSGALRASTDGHGLAVVEVSAWACLVDVGTLILKVNSIETR